MRRTTTLLTALGGLALLGATAIQARNAAGTAAPAAAPNATAGAVAAEGRVVTYPGGEVRVAAERAGRVVAIRFEESQEVRRGDVLLELDSDELQAALGAARARVAEAEADVRLTGLERDRVARLTAEGVAAERDLDQARRDVETTEARRRTARAEVERLEAQLRKMRVLAPISGTVVTRSVDAGETLEPGDAVAVIADLRRLRVDAEADEADAAALAVGAIARISADGYPGQAWEGRVEEVADAVTLRKHKSQDPSRPTDTRVLAVKVAFAEPSPLRLGTTVELRFER
jgi:RND family efflux transporter MFP subunit